MVLGDYILIPMKPERIGDAAEEVAEAEVVGSEAAAERAVGTGVRLEVVEAPIGEGLDQGYRAGVALYHRFEELSPEDWKKMRAELVGLDDDAYLERAGVFLFERGLESKHSSPAEKRARIEQLMNELEQDAGRVGKEVDEAVKTEFAASARLLEDLKYKTVEQLREHVETLPYDQLRYLAHAWFGGEGYMEGEDGKRVDAEILRQRLIALLESAHSAVTVEDIAEGRKGSEGGPEKGTPEAGDARARFQKALKAVDIKGLQELGIRYLREGFDYQDAVDDIIAEYESRLATFKAQNGWTDEQVAAAREEFLRAIGYSHIEKGIPVPQPPEGPREGIKARLRGKRIFGLPIGEFAAGVGAGYVIRGAMRTALAGVAGFVPAILAGGTAGAVVGGFRRFMYDRRQYRELLGSMRERGSGEVSVEALYDGIGRVDRRIAELMSTGTEGMDRKQARTTRRELELLQDQRRYMLVGIRKHAARTEGGHLDTMELLSIVTSTRHREEGVVEEPDAVVQMDTLQDRENTNRLIDEVMSAKRTNRKKMWGAVLRGAVVGAVGGTIGAWLADRVDWWPFGGHDARPAGGPPQPVDGGYPPPTSSIEVSGGSSVIEVGGGQTGPGGLGEEFIDAPKPSATEFVDSPKPSGTEFVDAQKPFVDAVKPEEFFDAPKGVPLPEGSNPWLEVDKWYSNEGYSLSTAEIGLLDYDLCHMSGVDVTEWGLDSPLGNFDDNALRIGYPLQLGQQQALMERAGGLEQYLKLLRAKYPSAPAWMLNQ